MAEGTSRQCTLAEQWKRHLFSAINLENKTGYWLTNECSHGWENDQVPPPKAMSKPFLNRETRVMSVVHTLILSAIPKTDPLHVPPSLSFLVLHKVVCCPLFISTGHWALMYCTGFLSAKRDLPLSWFNMELNLHCYLESALCLKVKIGQQARGSPQNASRTFEFTQSCLL